MQIIFQGSGFKEMNKPNIEGKTAVEIAIANKNITEQFF